MHYVWDQLTSSEPEFTDAKNAEKFSDYRDQQHLVLFLMVLTNEFEHVRASLLHRNPLPTLDQAVIELLSEETHFAPRKTTSVDAVFATPRGLQPNNKGHLSGSFQHKGHPSGSSKFCNYCKKPGHTLLECPIRVCQFCQKQATGHLQCDCFQNPNRYSQQYMSHSTPSRFAATTAEGSSFTTSSETFYVSNIEEIVKQVLAHSGNIPSTAMSVTSGNLSWFFDSACCNHMTLDFTIFATKHLTNHAPTIQTVDGSSMTVSHIGKISTLNTSLPDTYCIPQLTLNLISVGQLCDFGLTVILLLVVVCRIQRRDKLLG